MTPEQDATTLVIPGKWNRHILSPTWVAKNIFHVEAMQLEFALDIDLPPRYTDKSVRFIPGAGRVTFVALEQSDNILDAVEEQAKTLLTILKYTPITACGFNFAYSDDMTAEIAKLFEFSDNGRFNENGYNIKSSSNQRVIGFDDCDLKLRLSRHDNKVRFDFNFHYPVTNVETLTSGLGKLFKTNRQRAEEVLLKVYDLRIDQHAEANQ